jgi:hypothetical protein
MQCSIPTSLESWRLISYSYALWGLVCDVRFSSDGRYVACGGADRNAKIDCILFCVLSVRALVWCAVILSHISHLTAG